MPCPLYGVVSPSGASSPPATVVVEASDPSGAWPPPAGAEVVTFDPLTDAALPDGTRGVVIGGGFPEVHAARLAVNEPLRKELAGFAADGGAVAAECAGLLYLAASLDGEPMCGVLDAAAAMAPRLPGR